jgi:hypothetical protein
MVSVDLIIAFETGELSNDDTIRMFGEMVKDGSAWHLQGMYGRGAKSLIDRGYLSPSGEVLKLYGDGDGTE